MGSSYDNALAESFFQELKREWLHGRSLASKSQGRLELFDWLSYYNRRRRSRRYRPHPTCRVRDRLLVESRGGRLPCDIRPR
ncbi:integrase core domain-containing protein [Rhodococcus sp. WAY2]|uniref:integrase core domain-containing protein n=1 Tax=Rhodococcus sp. WAY2 TaxID=2663121 RepID=UPI003FA6ADDC